MSHSNSDVIFQLIATVHKLRAPGGCPWDRAQTHQSLRPYLIEEAYEVLDVLDQIESSADLSSPRIQGAFREELGDLLMQVVLHSEMALEAGAFSIYDVAQTLNEKLIRRHPHVFGEMKADSAETALQRWEKEKAKEKAKHQADASVLDGLPKNLPALQKASRIIEKVTKVGFQWKDLEGPLDKLEEELEELQNEVRDYQDSTQGSEADREAKKAKVEGELGDLFFSLCNIAHFLKISPEDALRKNTAKFERRFRHVETRLREAGKTPEQSDLTEMDAFWEEAKKIERVEVWGLTGGVGSGKSAAAETFKTLGIPVIDADQIARDISDNDPQAREKILSRFNTTDRSELRRICFSDPSARKDLEEILHPLIRAKSQKMIQELAITHPVIVYEAALLVETRRFQDFKGLIVIEAPKEMRIERILKREGITPQIAEMIMQSQTSDEERRMAAKHLLVNDGTLQDLKDQVTELVAKQKWNA